MELVPVSTDRHAASAWVKSTDYGHARSIQSVPVAFSELPDCCRSFPLAFILLEGRWTLACLFGVVAGQNLFVAPGGQWLGRHVPAVLRGYPFRLGKSGDTAFTLWVEDSVVEDIDAKRQAVPFFAGEAALHPDTQAMADLLTKTNQDIERMERAVATLVELELLEPWPLKAKDGDKEQTVAAISRINEKKLNTIGGGELAKLRDAGALAVAYAQLFSMGNIAVLAHLGQLHKHHTATKAAQLAIPEGSFVADGDDNLKIDWNSFLKSE